MTQKYGDLANEAVKAPSPCLVCDDPAPRYSWTDYSGEGYCVKCGTSYQLKWGELKEGESYPRCNVKPQWIPLLRKYWGETGKLNGCGNYWLMHDYPEQLAGMKTFDEWCEDHKDEIEAISNPLPSSSKCEAVSPPLKGQEVGR